MLAQAHIRSQCMRITCTVLGCIRPYKINNLFIVHNFSNLEVGFHIYFLLFIFYFHIFTVLEFKNMVWEYFLFFIFKSYIFLSNVKVFYDKKRQKMGKMGKKLNWISWLILRFIYSGTCEKNMNNYWYIYQNLTKRTVFTTVVFRGWKTGGFLFIFLFDLMNVKIKSCRRVFKIGEGGGW